MLDPVKKGYIETTNAISYLTSKVNDVRNFFQGSLRLKK